MAITSISSGAEDEVMMDINTTPLIDVMLVLIITIPVQLHAVKLDMPASQQPPPKPPVVVTLEIDADSTLRWNGVALAGRPALEDRLRAAAAEANKPEVQLRPNRLAPYASVAMVLATAQRLGVNQLGIVGNEQYAP